MIARWRDRWLARKRADAISEVRDDRALFEESVIAAEAAESSFSAELISRVLARFTELEDGLTTTTTKSQVENLLSQSAAAVQLRAYLAPPAELEGQAQTTLSTMADWGVPAQALDALRNTV